MADDIALNKAATIERCLRRIREDYADNPAHLKDQTRQDAIILNIQRACQAAIDLAMHEVRLRGIGVPQESREAFRLLVEAGHLEADLGTEMEKMVGFRNVTVHDYQALSLPIVQSIIERQLGAFEALARWALSAE